MRVLLVIPHYFKDIPNPVHSSNNINYSQIRKNALENVLLSWRSNFGESATLNFPESTFYIQPPEIAQLDINILTNQENHLLEQRVLDIYKCNRTNVIATNPKMLPFAAYQIFQREKNNYDWFVYSEDDLSVRDPLFFKKQEFFQNQFGYKRLLQPSRYELNSKGPRFKTYVDGDQSEAFRKSYTDKIPDDETLTLQFAQMEINFTRAKNPHSGFFCLNQKQFQYWESKDYFLDLDCSFVSPLESAATLGIVKTFSIYKSYHNSSFLEIEHLDDKFSNIAFER